ncbi:DnaJ-related protein SCJ1 [Spathaspora sp. JA1]|nr:DnaJ-related protein SCJ1 [Spathaspora sp. JA1]
MQFSILTTFLLFVAIVIAKQHHDFYQVLGLDKDATDKQIRSAYKQLSLKYHPDKNPGNEEAHDKFIEIGEAYEVLSNAEKRRNYDQFGDPEGRGPQGGQQFDFGDMFGQFFGGQGGGQRQRGVRRGDNVQIDLNIGLGDFYNGKITEFVVKMMNDCKVCDGTGSQDKEKHVCDRCKGTGHITVKHQLGPGMIQQVRMQCDRCGGVGKVIAHPCAECKGKGAVEGPRHYDIYIKPGQPRDSNHVLEGEGHKSPNWVPGDLIINIREDFSKSWGYRRVQNNLYRTEILTLKEALNGGWERKIKFLDIEDDTLVLNRSKGQVVMDGEVEAIKGKGMPVLVEHDEEEQFGDLFIEYRVIIPGGTKNRSEKDEL